MVKCGSCVHFPELGIKHFFAPKWEKIKESIEIPLLTRCCFCFPLRIGLLTFVYINLVLTIIATCFLSMYISYNRNASEADWMEFQSEFKRLVFDIVGLVFELVFSVIFIAALYKKHVLLMKVYMYFEILYSIIGFIYSVAFLTNETVSELFLILFQMMLQLYLVILIWSLIVKMARDGSAKYIRENDPA